MRSRSSHPLSATAALALAALATAVAETAPAGAATSTKRAARAVSVKLHRGGFQTPRIRCRRTVRRRARWVCRWRGTRQSADDYLQSCAGRYKVARRKRRWKLRRRGPLTCTRRDLRFGFNDNAVRAGRVSAEEDARLTADTGASLQRLTFDWRYAEPRPGELHLGPYDEIYHALRSRGIRPLFILMFAPRWTWAPWVTCVGDCRYPPAPDHYDAWREIAATLARRYPGAAGIEIWNEPNYTGFWDPRPDPAHYAELLSEAYRAIKGADPRMPVIAGGLADVNSTAGNLDAPTFARAVYDSGGAGAFDALNIHLYPRSIREGDPFPSLSAVRAVRDAHGDAGKPVWVTEFGVSSTRPGGSESDQASFLPELYRQLRAQPSVERVFLHTLIEPTGPTRSDVGFGILRPTLKPKPAYCTLVEAVRGQRPCP